MSLADPAAGDGVGATRHRSTGALPSGTALPPVELAHLRRMTTPLGIWEHADHTVPRVEHGSCTDDNARALIVVCRQPPDATDIDLAATYLRFLLAAQTADGRFHNRRHADGTWLDEVGSDDAQGRALWGLGTVSCRGPEPWMREAGSRSLVRGARTFTSRHLRANAFATLGAAEFLDHRCDDDVYGLLHRTVSVVATAVRSGTPWPEPRLTYDNARLPDALLAAGAVLGDGPLIELGLELLRWLVAVETSDAGHPSFTPVGGWAPGEPRPAFDQQPVEAAAMADACARAWRITGDTDWSQQVRRVAWWFLGGNDVGAVLYDRRTGGCADGLEAVGVNLNRGAESTLAALATLQTGRDL